MDPVAAFARNVKAQRAAAGLTQDQVADACGMDVGQYRNIEGGQTNTSIRTASRVAAGLGLESVGPLFDGVPADATARSRRGQMS